MRDQTTALYAQVHDRVDEILHNVWDPIGVVGHPEARDEYDAYVPKIVKMLLDGSGASEIAGHLEAIATGRMGLSATSPGSHSSKVAEILVANFAHIKNRSDALRA